MVNAPLAQTSSADQLLRWLLEQLLSRIESECGEPCAVVLTGSLARGEGTVFYPGSRPLILSDIDLAVVYREPAERDRFAAKLTGLARDRGIDYTRWGLLAAIDLGAFALSDLPRQKARPGTLDWRQSGMVIAGDSEVLDRLPSFAAEDIPTDEILLLCENRLLELLWAHQSLEREGSAAFAALYAGGKAVLDGGLAWLVRQGDFPATTPARLAALDSRPREERALLGEEFLEAARFWTAFKLDPSLDPVSKRYHGYREPRLLAREAWREGASHLLEIYRGLVLEGREPDDADLAAWRLAAARAPRRRRLRRWWEAWMESSERELGWAGLAALLGRSTRGTPEHLMGAAAAALVATAPEMNGSGMAVLGGVDAARQLSPIRWSSETTWQERRRSLVQAWDRWVLRGTRTVEGEAPWDPR